jgi:hypothetical protein
MGEWRYRSTYSRPQHYLEFSGQLHPSPSRPFTPGAYCIRGWVDPRTRLDDVEGEKSCPYRDSNSDPSAVQPVASRYTDCDIPALCFLLDRI